MRKAYVLHIQIISMWSSCFLNRDSTAKRILVVLSFKQRLNFLLLRTLDQPCGIGKHGGETNRSLWALTGLRPIRIISLHHGQEGGIEKRSERNEKTRKRRSNWEDESGSDIKTGIECGAKGRREERPRSFKSLRVCVCAYASTQRASVAPRM